MGVNDWRDTFVGDNGRLVRPWNEVAAVAALRLVKSLEEGHGMVPDNAPAFLGYSPTLDKVPHATGK
jgi:hypothetical protein